MVDNIMDTLNEIEYGFKDEDGNNIINNKDKWDNEFDKFYYLQEPDELLKSKCGVCWDQVELERLLFSNLDIKFKTYFIYIKGDNMLPSHTFLEYLDNGKYYWFEHSWYREKGIHEYDSEEELLLDVEARFLSDYKGIKDVTFYVYEYVKPIKHIKCMGFYDFIGTQKLIKERRL